MLARKTLLLLLSDVINSFMGLVSTFVVAHFMGPEALGTIGYAMSLLGFMSMFGDLGFTHAHLKRASEKEEIGEYIGTFLLIKGLLIIPIALAICLAPPISEWLGHVLFENTEQKSVFYLLAIVPLLRNIQAVFTLTFQARQESAKLSLVSTASSLLSAGFQIVVAIRSLGILALGGARLMEGISAFVLALILFRGYKIERPRKDHLHGYVSYAWPLMLIGAYTAVLGNLDRIVLQRSWSIVEVGYYVGVQGILGLMNKVSSVAMRLFLPKTSEDAFRGDLKVIKTRLFLAEKYLLTIMVPLAIGIIHYRCTIITILLGDEFMPAASTLAIMALASLIVTFFAPYSSTLYAVEKHHPVAIIYLINTAILVVANIILVPRQFLGQPMLGLGSMGAALSLLCSWLIDGALQALLVKRHARIGLYWRVWRYALAGLSMFVFLYLSGLFLTLPGLWAVLLLGPPAVLTYLGVLALFNEFTRTDAHFLFDLASPAKMISYIIAELKTRESTA